MIGFLQKNKVLSAMLAVFVLVGLYLFIMSQQDNVLLDADLMELNDSEPMLEEDVLPVPVIEDSQDSIPENKLAEIRADLKKVTDSLNMIIEDNVSINNKVIQANDNYSVLLTEIVGIKKSIASMGGRLSALEKKNKKVKRRKYVNKNKPPFKLISIDQWGGYDSAVVSMNGKTGTAMLGGTKAGWSFTKFMRPSCVVVEKSGRARKLCIKS